MPRHHLKHRDFTPSCPAGGQWYACADSKFVGCCASDPCKNDCAAGSLRPASFPKEQYEQFPDASCESGSKFYTCTGTPGGPFWGCCKSNPCEQGGCPDGDLTGAFVNKPKQLEAYSLTGFGMSSTSTTMTSKTATLEARTTSTGTVPQVTVTASPTPAAKPIAAIAGGAAGGGVGLAIIIGLLIYYICHAKRSRQGHNDEVERRLSAKAAAKTGENKATPLSPPPTYFSPDSISQHGAPSPASSRTYHHEMPGIALSPTPSHMARKENGRNRLSELSGDTARRSELDGQWGSSNPNSWSPPHTPHAQHTTRQFPTHSRDASGTVQLLGTWEEDPTPHTQPRQPSSVYATSPHTSPVYGQPSHTSPVYVSPVYTPQSPYTVDRDQTAHSPPASRQPSGTAYPPEQWPMAPEPAHTPHQPRRTSRTFRSPERTAQWVDSHTSPQPGHEQHEQHGPEAWPEYDEHAGYRGDYDHVPVSQQQQQQGGHGNPEWPTGPRDNVRGYPGV